MEKRKLKIILDPAHGEEVAGKRSPDGTHREYKWSRERCKNIKTLLEEQNFEVYYSNDTEKEIGLSKRVSVANSLCKGKENEFLFISPHNNAAGMGDQWLTATGFEVYITTKNTKSKEVATIMLSDLAKYFPSIKNRGLKTANFTVISVNCYSFLIEFLFQDNKGDVELLKDPKINKTFEECVLDTVIKIDEKLFGVYKKAEEKPIEILDNVNQEKPIVEQNVNEVINEVSDNKTIEKPVSLPTVTTNSSQSNNNIINVLLNSLSKFFKGIFG